MWHWRGAQTERLMRGWSKSQGLRERPRNSQGMMLLYEEHYDEMRNDNKDSDAKAKQFKSNNNSRRMRNQRRSSVGGEGAADTSGAVPPSPLLRWLTLKEFDLMGFSGQGQFEGWHQLKSEGQRRWLGCLSSCSSSSASSTCTLSSRSGVLRIGLSLHLFPSPNKLTAPLSKGKGSHDTRFSDSILHEFILD